jgi:hypothetical protein
VSAFSYMITVLIHVNFPDIVFSLTTPGVHCRPWRP